MVWIAAVALVNRVGPIYVAQTYVNSERVAEARIDHSRGQLRSFAFEWLKC